MKLVNSSVLDARLPAIDIYRSIAILLVVLYHFPVAVEFVIYVIGSFILAIITTKLIEEPFLKLRNKFADTV